MILLRILTYQTFGSLKKKTSFGTSTNTECQGVTHTIRRSIFNKNHSVNRASLVAGELCHPCVPKVLIERQTQCWMVWFTIIIIKYTLLQHVFYDFPDFTNYLEIHESTFYLYHTILVETFLNCFQKFGTKLPFLSKYRDADCC